MLSRFLPTLKLLFVKYFNMRQAKIFRVFNPLADDKSLNWSKLKQIADDILKYI